VVDKEGDTGGGDEAESADDDDVVDAASNAVVVNPVAQTATAAPISAVSRPPCRPRHVDDDADFIASDGSSELVTKIKLVAPGKAPILSVNNSKRNALLQKQAWFLDDSFMMGYDRQSRFVCALRMR
jgi:hypothetical protein